MEFIPLIKIKNRKTSASDELLDTIDESQILYLHDLDGIEKDKPNLCTVQRLSKSHELWVDSGPRNLGDVVDSFMAGATAITIRETLFPQITLSKIREISENKIYVNINLEKQNTDDLFLQEVDGLTSFTKREKIEQEFIYRDLLRRYTSKNTVYVYESNKDNIHFWKNYGSDAFLVDLEKFEEFKKHGL